MHKIIVIGLVISMGVSATNISRYISPDKAKTYIGGSGFCHGDVSCKSECKPDASLAYCSACDGRDFVGCIATDSSKSCTETITQTSSKCGTKKIGRIGYSGTCGTCRTEDNESCGRRKPDSISGQSCEGS
jgi:hypothetical protein